VVQLSFDRRAAADPTSIRVLGQFYDALFPRCKPPIQDLKLEGGIRLLFALTAQKELPLKYSELDRLKVIEKHPELLDLGIERDEWNFFTKQS